MADRYPHFTISGLEGQANGLCDWKEFQLPRDSKLGDGINDPVLFVLSVK